MPMYKLRRSLYDGKRHYRAGEVVEMEEGQAPSSAILVEGQAPAEPNPEPELDLEPVLDPKPGDTLSSLSKSKK